MPRTCKNVKWTRDAADAPRRSESRSRIAYITIKEFCPDWLSTTLRDGRIHCSNPINLNDPWDCCSRYSNFGTIRHEIELLVSRRRTLPCCRHQVGRLKCQDSLIPTVHSAAP